MIRSVVIFSVSSLLIGAQSVPTIAGSWLERNGLKIDTRMAYFYGADLNDVREGVRKRVRRRAINPVKRRSLLKSREVKPRSRAPSIAISIGRDGKLLFAKGYGQARVGVQADEHTLYHIGSVTKQFTAAVLLDLVANKAVSRANGRPVDLDTPLHQLFFGVEHWSKDGEPPVTIRRLLTMTSNLPNYTRRLPRELNPWGAIKAPRLLAAIKRMQTFGWPGSFEYSNTSYFLLAQIIESLTLEGEDELYSYSGRLRVRGFEQANMTATRFVGDELDGAVLALPHDARRPAFMKADWLKGSADVVSSVSDMFAWNSALMSGKIVSAQMRELMFSEAARVTPMEWYGMGWFVKPEKRRDIYYHSGTVPGYTSINMIARERETGRWSSVTILTNGGQIEGLERLALDVVDMALD